MESQEEYALGCNTPEARLTKVLWYIGTELQLAVVRRIGG